MQQEQLRQRVGRPKKRPEPDMSMGEILIVKKNLEDVMQKASVPKKKKLKFGNAVTELRPWIIKFLDSGYGVQDFIEILGNSIQMSEHEARSIFLEAQITN